MNAIVQNAAGSLVANLAHDLIKWVLARIIEEIKLARHFKKNLMDLQNQLTRLSLLLQGASSQQVNSPLLADWLKNINEVAHHADNLLDTWSYTALKFRFGTEKKHRFINQVSKPILRLRMAHKVRSMRKLISSVYKDAKVLGIKPVKVAEDKSHDAHPTVDRKLFYQRVSPDASLFLGREKDLTQLVSLLCDPFKTESSSDLDVIGIVGMGGLGKTTLSKRISYENTVTQFFDKVIWLVVSESFDLIDGLNRMVQILGETNSNMNDREALISKIREKLENKKNILLILDDVWHSFDWETFYSTLEDIGKFKGATILVTSREKQVVKKMVTTRFNDNHEATLQRPTIYPLQGLSDGDSWSLFVERISDEDLLGSEKELIARRMLKNCGGVPLAIRALGDLLRDKSEETWREIEKSDVWRQEHKNGILPSLRLSYDYLPTIALKLCFSFCAIFEEDHVFHKDLLVCMWMAQGFLQPYDRMELKGEEYIEDLLNNSLFQEEGWDKYGNVMTFKMHDLVRTLAIDVSMGECLCLYKDFESSKVRHMSIPDNTDTKDLTFTSSTKLQTCLVYKNSFDSAVRFGLKCKNLRVLNVGTNGCYNFDWKPLGSLIHLRYFEIELDETWDDEIYSNLGKQINKLYHLQTLRIKKKTLRINHGFLSPSEEYVELLLNEIRDLVNLRHIFTNRFIGIPLGMRNFNAMQSLPVIYLKKNRGGTQGLGGLGPLTNLRGTLEINGLMLINVAEAQSLNLGNKSYLDNLVLKWRGGDIFHLPSEKNPNADEVLKALKPNVNLRKLEIWGYNGTKFPSWLTSGDPQHLASNIVSLKMKDCSEAKGNLPLENFKFLRFLTVKYCNKLTVTLPNEGAKCCKSLEKLKIDSCRGVKDVQNLSSLSQLGCLTIIYNTKRSGGELKGLGDMPCLRELRTDLLLPTELGKESRVCKSLEVLKLEGFKRTQLPDQLQHLKTLQQLWIEEFSHLEMIPEWMGNLKSLRQLVLYDLPKLKTLPCEIHLSSLIIDGCPLLMEDVANQTGEWLKIAHIPSIKFSIQDT